MLNWLNNNIGVVVSIIGGGLVAAGFVMSAGIGEYNARTANIAQELSDLRSDLRASDMDQGEILANLSDKIQTGFLDIRQRLAMQQSDVRRVLVGTNTVEPNSVFVSAVIDGGLWIFPSDPLLVDMEAKGYRVEKATDMVGGIRLADWDGVKDVILAGSTGHSVNRGENMTFEGGAYFGLGVAIEGNPDGIGDENSDD